MTTFLKKLGIVFGVGMLMIVPATGVFSADFYVVTTEDLLGADCKINSTEGSLRCMVLISNDSPGPDIIHLPAGYYALTREGEEGAYFGYYGDLDITDDVTIVGAGMDATVISIVPHDRIFHIQAPGKVIRFENLTIRAGRPPSPQYGGGVLIDNAST